jgi:hypothetical protein
VLGVGASNSGALGGAFIGARGRMVAWARAAGEGETRGKNQGCICVTGASSQVAPRSCDRETGG